MSNSLRTFPLPAVFAIHLRGDGLAGRRARSVDRNRSLHRSDKSFHFLRRDREGGLRPAKKINQAPIPICFKRRIIPVASSSAFETDRPPPLALSQIAPFSYIQFRSNDISCTFSFSSPTFLQQGCLTTDVNDALS